jgi:GNAT superfamily N-acetyltransferase
MRIEKGSAEDVPVILEMIRGLAEYEKLAEHCVATEDKLRETLFGPRPFAETLLVWENGKCCGFALFFTNYSTFLAQPGIFLEDLFVKPEERGRGYGKALLTRLAQIAQERGCSRVDWLVLDWNEPSIRFYRSLGAVPMEDWTGYRLTGDALYRLAGA